MKTTARVSRIAFASLVMTMIAVPSAIAAQPEDTSMVTRHETEQARNKALVSASFERWRAGTGSPFELLDDDAPWTIVGRSAAAGTYADREAFMAAVIRPFNARMKVGLKPSIRNIYAEGSTVIVLFDGHAEARDGRPYENTYAWFLDLRNDRIVNATAFFDSIEFDDFWHRVEP